MLCHNMYFTIVACFQMFAFITCYNKIKEKIIENKTTKLQGFLTVCFSYFWFY